MQTIERSRAYPVLSLEEGRCVMGEVLARLGEGSFSREVLGEILGYSNARGGPGARKIAALAQYGFLRRNAGLYSPTVLARNVVELSSKEARRSALRRALRQPPLFTALLDRYQPQGRVPSQLASVLWRDYGITRKASRAAAATFYKSARYAGVLDPDGAFLPDLEDSPQMDAHQTGQAEQKSQAGCHETPDRRPSIDRVDSDQRDRSTSVSEQRFEFALTNGRMARLALPLKLCRQDLDIVHRQIDFLEYQVTEEEAHEQPDPGQRRDPGSGIRT